MKIAIAGCLGRMGLTLVEAVQADDDFTLTIGSERAGYNVTETQTALAAYGAANLFITSDPKELAAKADAVIDFTAPDATLAVARAVADKGGIHIIGTTGWSDEQQKELVRYAKGARIVQSGNFSLGINVLERVVEEIARILDDAYDIEISEMHHKHKKDAPSGTALMLGRAAASGRKTDLDKKKVIDRKGVRKTGDIGFSIARGGDVVGIHNVTFAGPGELITLKHQAFNRAIYAAGALKAARWAKKKKPGLYTMKDVLDERD
jgi:4-hydroxy-tetrahydrodipicolinate reductase